MAPGVDDAARLMGELSVVNHTAPLEASQHRLAFIRTNEKLITTADEMIEQARLIQYGITFERRLVSQDIAALSARRRNAKQLADTVQTANSALEDHIVAYVISLGDRDQGIHRLISYFKHHIESIVSDILDATTDDNIALWRILEECYNQAISESGCLHSENYFIALQEIRLGSPYYPDFESDEIHEDENGSQIDDSYAMVERVRQERAFEQITLRKKRIDRCWIAF